MIFILIYLKMDDPNEDQNNSYENEDSQNNEVKFQEYYENEGGEEKLMMTDGKNIANFQEIMDENIIKDIINRKKDEIQKEKNEEFDNINNNINNKKENEFKNNINKNNININVDNNNDNNDNDSLEREEMENEYELVKSLNDLKEKNKKLEAMNNYQKIKIESLENELEKANTINQGAIRHPLK